MKGRVERDATKPRKGFRNRLYWWLENPNNPDKWKLDLVLVSVIVSSIVVIVAKIAIEPDESALLDSLDLAFLGVFVLEYSARFTVSTDFFADCRDRNIWKAVKAKLRWMTRPFSIIDAFALIPSTRALRTMRLFRLLRIARLLRVLKIARYAGGLDGYVKEFRKRAYELFILGFVTVAVLAFASVTIFCVEKPAGNEQIRTILDAGWWSVVTLTTVGYGDTYPITFVGRAIAAMLMMTSIATIGGIGAVVTSAIMSRIDDAKAGKAAMAQLSGHILFCGWTPCAEKVAKALFDSDILDESKLAVLTSGEPPAYDACTYYNGDPTSITDLKRANADTAGFCVIFLETGSQRDNVPKDRMAVMIALQVKSLNPECRVVLELSSRKFVEGIKHRLGDIEVIAKEHIDADIILNTIRNVGQTSKMLCDVSDFQNNRLVVRRARDVLHRDFDSVSVREVKRHLIGEKASRLFLGYLESTEKSPVLNPPNDRSLRPDTQVYLLERASGEASG